MGWDLTLYFINWVALGFCGRRLVFRNLEVQGRKRWKGHGVGEITGLDRFFRMEDNQKRMRIKV
jgi:hypothetical protein